MLYDNIKKVLLQEAGPGRIVTQISIIVVMDFWSGALGFFFGLAANNISERWTLYRARRAAGKLAGEWVAHTYQPNNNRSIDAQRMAGAGLTVIFAKSLGGEHIHTFWMFMPKTLTRDR